MTDPVSNPRHEHFQRLWLAAMNALHELKRIESAAIPHRDRTDLVEHMLRAGLRERLIVLGAFRALVAMDAADMAGGLWLCILNHWEPVPEDCEPIGLGAFLLQIHTSKKRRVKLGLSKLGMEEWRLLYLMVMRGENHHRHMLAYLTNISPGIWEVMVTEMREEAMLRMVKQPA
jgi:hypothetical protein